MVVTIVDALGVPLSLEIATHVYLAIVTDTGSFHFSHMTPRTFDLARRTVEAGVDPEAMARAIFDSNNLGRLKIFGAVLNGMRLDDSGRVALLIATRETVTSSGGSYDDTDGIINFPLTVKDIQAVAFFKDVGPDDWRVSMRSKGDVDVGAIARSYGGGGHRNAAGCSAKGSLEQLQDTFIRLLVQKTNAATEARRHGDPS
jgi:phosphoesterase RecJ-like protein